MYVKIIARCKGGTFFGDTVYMKCSKNTQIYHWLHIVYVICELWRGRRNKRRIENSVRLLVQLRKYPGITRPDRIRWNAAIWTYGGIRIAIYLDSVDIVVTRIRATTEYSNILYQVSIRILFAVFEYRFSLFMAAPRSGCRHYIFVLWFLLLSSYYLFPRLISAVADWVSTIFRHMMWP